MAERKAPTSVNEKLRQARISRGWSQQDLADQLGIVVGTVNRWERGKQQPTPYYRLKLSALFGTTAEALGLGAETVDPAQETNIQPENQQAEYLASTDAVPNEQPPPPLEDLTIQAEPPEQKTDTDTTDPLHIDQKTQTADELTPTQNQSKHATRRIHWNSRTALLLLLALVLLTLLATTLFGKLFAHQSPPVSIHPPTSKHPTATSIPNVKEQLVFDDPLTTNLPANQWSIGDSCSFKNGHYHISSSGANYCLMAKQGYTDMRYQIEMSLLTGTWAGVVFRANGNSNLYYFSLSAQGQYEADMIGPTNKKLLLGNSSAILTGSGKWNVLEVEAYQTHLLFSVNGHLIGQVQDATYPSGDVGVCVGYYDNTSDPTTTTAIFRNVLVWQLLPKS
jgi:transcriptional regulator with XRE-family HTH domain